MTGVFVAFAMADIASMRQLGIGLTTAVVLDATVVRLVLLPALIKLCGDWNWWLPGWLDRLLPRLDVEGTAEHAPRDPAPDLNGHGDRAARAARGDRTRPRLAGRCPRGQNGAVASFNPAVIVLLALAAFLYVRAVAVPAARAGTTSRAASRLRGGAALR